MPRGINERSVSELAAIARGFSPTASSTDREWLAGILSEMGAAGDHVNRAAAQLQLHLRLALCFTTVVLSVLAVAIARVGASRNRARAAFIAIVALYVLAFGRLTTAAHLVVSPSISPWVPNAAIAGLSLCLFVVHSRRRRTTYGGVK